MQIRVDIRVAADDDPPRRRRDQASLSEGNNSALLALALPTTDLHYVSRNKVVLPPCSPSTPAMSNLFAAAEGAFGEHYNFALAPEVVWYAIVHEIAYTVKENARSYAHFFTDNPEAKQTIKVRDDSLVFGSSDNDWAATISMFYPALAAKIAPEIVDLFLPPLSTLTVEDQVTILLAFMDTVSPFYEFRVETRCGIPMIQIEGTIDDWKLIADRISTMQTMFVQLEEYFGRLSPVIEQIVSTLETGSAEPEFWRSLYKVDEQSGCVEIDGWLTTLLAYKSTRDGRVLRRNSDRNAGWGSNLGFGPSIKPDMIPSHISSVPFIWEYYGEEIPMIFFGGVLGVDDVGESTLRPRLGFGVAQPRAETTQVEA